MSVSQSLKYRYTSVLIFLLPPPTEWVKYLQISLLTYVNQCVEIMGKHMQMIALLKKMCNGKCPCKGKSRNKHLRSTPMK